MAKQKRTGAQQGLYRIGTVAQLTGISTHALRAWERRYSTAVSPSRTEGGGRLYSEQDVARFRLIKQLLDRGHSIRQVVGMTLPHLQRTLDASRIPLPTDALPASPLLRRRVMAALLALDTVEADRLLSRALVEQSPRELVTEVVIPLLEEICVHSDRGSLRKAHEHAYSTVFCSLLCAMSRANGRRKNVGNVVVATVDGEPHGFGALLAAFIAVLHGWPTVHLGCSLPTEDLIEAVALTRPELLILPFLQHENATSGTALVGVLDSLPSSVEVLLTGRAAEVHAARVEPESLLPSLEDLEERLSRSEVTSRVMRRAFKELQRCSM